MLLIAALGAPRAFAQDASTWDVENHAAARLLAGVTVKSADATYLRAAVEIKLDPGWKTYWREPGDSGVPPALDFAGSENVTDVQVQWPAPERYPDGAGGYSIGYLDQVILPLRVRAGDPAKPSLLRLKLDYAVCGNLCVPAEANLQLRLDGDGAEENIIEKADSRVPRRVKPGAGPGSSSGAGSGLAILSVHREPGDAHERVVVEVAVPDGGPVDLFAEGPTPEWSLPLPEPEGGDGPTRRFSFDLDGLPPGAKAKGADLTLTAVTPNDAIEVPVRLD